MPHAGEAAPGVAHSTLAADTGTERPQAPTHLLQQKTLIPQDRDSRAPWTPSPYHSRQTPASTTVLNWKVTSNLLQYQPRFRPPASEHTLAEINPTQEPHGRQPATPGIGESCSGCKVRAPRVPPAQQRPGQGGSASGRREQQGASPALFLCHQHPPTATAKALQGPRVGNAAAGTRTRGDGTLVSSNAANGHCRGVRGSLGKRWRIQSLLQSHTSSQKNHSCFSRR